MLRTRVFNEKNTTENLRFHQYVKERKFQLITCSLLGVEDELCVPAKEVGLSWFNVFCQLIPHPLPSHIPNTQNNDKSYPRKQTTLTNLNPLISRARRASGDLSRLLCKVVDVVGKNGSLFKLACPYGILNSLYDMGDLELLNSVVDISHWVETAISLHAAAKQASFSLSCKRCKCKCNCTAKSCKCRKTEVPCGSKCHPGSMCLNV